MAYRHLNEKDRFYIEQRLSEGDSIAASHGVLSTG
ncbi:hypothetical protein PsalMR5_01858 [Piscirickettsia salmonis]|nr:hypothetical protein PsalSR1_02257 [Piscirickettsia salmonis]QGP59290.1 hypothetical protein PsalBI1_01877 [Piscirickettsia salmonis]QGP63994.1 hypothetical protein PsalMR5_01858 [Piscirickettsia salmonis]